MSKSRHSLMLIFSVVIVYFNSFWGVFQFDDYNVIVHNTTVHSWQSWFNDLGKGIRPFLKLSYLINWTSGAWLFGFHLVNVTVHSINVVIFYLLVRKIVYCCGVLPGNQKEVPAGRVAFIAALLFAIHPVQTEAVTYICGRSASLMALFYLFGILLYMEGRDAESSVKKLLLLYILTPLLFVSALLIKETAVTFPLVLLLLNRFNLWKENSDLKSSSRFKKKIIFLLIFIAAVFALIAHPKYGRLLEYSFDIRSMDVNILTQINGVSYLLSRLVVLNGMNIDPDLPVITAWEPLIIAEASLLSVFFIIGLISFKSRPWIGAGVLWFFLHLIPTNSIVPRLDVANDRQLYLASMGIFFVLAVEIVRLESYMKEHWTISLIRTAYTGLALILLLFCFFTIVRNNAYQSEIALWEESRIKSPHKARVYNNLGYAYYMAGRGEEARKAYLTALRLSPDYTPARNNLGALHD